MLMDDALFAALSDVGPARRAIWDAHRMDEALCVSQRIEQVALDAATADRVEERARDLVKRVREERVKSSGIDAFMHEYELSSHEGVVLMCLAEALLRIPDAETADALIKDKIGGGDWEGHLGHSDSWFVNASTWGLMLTGRIVGTDPAALPTGWQSVLNRLIHRSGEPVIRQAVVQAMRVMGLQFVMGRTIGEAIERAKPMEGSGYCYSYDMLGEAARTKRDAERYFQSYHDAIEVIGRSAQGRGPQKAPGISVKLSALHPRYEHNQREAVMGELLPRLIDLCQLAKSYDIGLCVDAEEADRLEISLDVISGVSRDASLKSWDGLGLAVQAYQKRALPVVDWLAELAKRDKRRLMVRLVKGAYWDTEIKRAQETGQSGYPVFTRKVSTDVSYIACANRLMAEQDAFYPCFATHNAHSVASILEMAGNRTDFEFQRLHGMGDALYEQIVGSDKLNQNCRIYAPVGSHEDLLAYLVRRLLENGANTSFVNRIVDEAQPLASIVADPVAAARRLNPVAHPDIPLPGVMFGSERQNSAGFDFTDTKALIRLRPAVVKAKGVQVESAPIIGGRAVTRGEPTPVLNPADHADRVGLVYEASTEDAVQALDRASRAFHVWNSVPAKERSRILNRVADFMERDSAALMTLVVREAGKSWNDAIAELREAVDFLRYYGGRAEVDFGPAQMLPGPTGERNTLQLHGRGTFLCISPWNFPLAIFTGQVSAALAAGNAALAKPAEQTPLIAAAAVRLFHEAGVPVDALALLPGDGPMLGRALLGDDRLSGVAFTGSTETARAINRALAGREGPIIPLIAETGGQNAMIVDSSALPEQVTRDVLISAFQSAGQRCSALRVLFVQDDVADHQIAMIRGAMECLTLGDPSDLLVDIGPVIDSEAKAMLDDHVNRMKSVSRHIGSVPLSEKIAASGTFVAPEMFEIENLEILKREVFGPVLHVIRYPSGDLERVIDAINATGYGLTLSVHSRIERTVDHILDRVRVGNAYVNRNQIGAIVGVQPFGGEGLSGTGPKAGGPRYLYRFATERATSIDTTAAGGNTSLMSLEA